MARLRGWLRAAASSPLATSLAMHVVLIRYLAVGGFVGLMDLGFLNLLLLAHASVVVASTVSYFVMGVGLHFTINKLVTFRNLERSTLHLQIRSYAIVTGICYLTMLGIIEAFVHAGSNPLYPSIGKAVSIVVNVPIAFLCNRAFTFAPRERAPGEGGTGRPPART